MAVAPEAWSTCLKDAHPAYVDQDEPKAVGGHLLVGHLCAPYAVNDSIAAMRAYVATLTVRNLDEALVRALRIRAAEHGRSAEAEHREILHQVLTASRPDLERAAIADRLEAFRKRTAGRGSAAATELLRESREDRTGELARSSS